MLESRWRNSLPIAVAVARLLSFSSSKAVATPIAAIEYNTPGPSWIVGDGSRMVGRTFNLNNAVRVVSLGRSAIGSINFGPPTQAEVGLWDPSGTLLASTTVFSTDPLVGHFRYRDIAPLELPAANGYTVTALWPSVAAIVATPTGQATPSDVAFVADRYEDPVATLQRPTSPHGNIALVPTHGGMLGGTFAFDHELPPPAVVPEPGRLALLGCGLLGIVRRRRRR